MENRPLETEWCLLQNQFDSYEKHSLYIKLVGIVVLIVGFVLVSEKLFTTVMILVLWLQDGIWKTFQSRIESRLLRIENSILDNKAVPAFQFNSEFSEVRLTGLVLLSEYINQSIRPTVAFPYIVLIFILWVSVLF